MLHNYCRLLESLELFRNLLILNHIDWMRCVSLGPYMD